MSRGPYLGRFKCLQEDGPPELVAILGHDEGRWSSAFQLRRNEPALNYLDMMRAKHSLGPSLAGHARTTAWHLLGFVIMSSWRVADPISTQFTVAAAPHNISSRDLLHGMSYGSSPTKPKAILEYPILVSASLSSPQPLPPFPNLDSLHDSLDSATFAHMIWGLVSDASTEIVDFSEAEPRTTSAPSLLKKWQHRFRIAAAPTGVPPFLGWRVWRALGEVMVRGMWQTDVIKLGERFSGKDALRLRAGQPPQKLLLQFLKIKACHAS